MADETRPPVQLETDDRFDIWQMRDQVYVGHYYVFAREAKALGLGSDRRSRLGIGPALTANAVIPLEDEVKLSGGTLRRTGGRSFGPLGCVVSDRDLYRAEEDVVNLFIALPADAGSVKLEVEADGSPFTTREVELARGVAVETLAMLLPGEYSVRLTVDGRAVGEPATFTVAEYTLAPLAARLVSHQLDRTRNKLAFSLEVESYQVPLDEAVVVELLDGDRPVGNVVVKPESPGAFAGVIALRGEGPFRLRVAPKSDAGRAAEVVIPGTRAHERKLTRLNELGQEKLFSLMPEPGSIPLRGGYLSDGDHVASPLTVEEVVTDRPTIEIRSDLVNLHATIIDQITGEVRVVELGDRVAGESFELDVDTALCTVVFGCWLGRPFEGYTSFVRPSRVELELDVPMAASPRDDLTVTIRVGGAHDTVPVLISVRDERLTAADSPQSALASTWKTTVEDAVAAMEETGFATLADLLEVEPRIMSWDQIAAWDAEDMPLNPSHLVSGALEWDSMVRGRGFGGLGRFQSSATGAFAVQDAAPALAEGAAMPPPRTDFAEIVFFGLVEVTGTHELVLPLSDATTSYVVEAFALAGDDWAQSQAHVIVDQDVRVDLELPSSVHPEDDATGIVRVATASGRAHVTLRCDGREVAVEGLAGEVATPVELRFSAGPGDWEAVVEDPESGESDAVVRFVDKPGNYRRRIKALRLLKEGDSLDLDSADALTLRVLPGLDASFDSLVEASASYAHLCCEQTAAKMLAATFMVLTADDARAKKKAEKIIISGAKREQSMFRAGKGFSMYPGSRQISEYYSKLTVRYLWRLRRLVDVREISAPLRRAVNEALDLAAAAADVHDMKPVPASIVSMEDAYAAISNGGDVAKAMAYVDAHLKRSGRSASLSASTHRIADRASLAYAAATLARAGRLADAVDVADQVTRDFNEAGRLYSTVDTTAAVVMMLELKTSGIAEGSAQVHVNGENRTAVEASALADQVETIEVLEGIAVVEVTRITEERWDSYEGSFGVEVGFRDESGGRARKFEPGHRYQLLVKLKEGYQNGDLVHVALPPSMAWLRGGGRVQSFTVDFEGADQLSVPVVVVAGFIGKQHYAACVRNMFEEERASSPGLMTVKNKSGWFW